MATPQPTGTSGTGPVVDDSELVLGLVAPVGTNFERFQHSLDRCLKRFGYVTKLVRLSELLTRMIEVTETPEGPKGSKEAARLRRLMHAGNNLRHKTQRGDLLALAAVSTIRSQRPPERVMVRTAHIIRSLKHPDEVRTLRRIYGSGFYLIGVTVEESQRRDYLEKEKGCSLEEINALLLRDEHEEDGRFIKDGQNYGQQTRDTFHLADVFIPLDAEEQLDRFLKLVFGCPFETPTQDEHAMFLAFGAALRSGDLSRQVGAVITNARGDVVAVGANDVPRAGGGLYWPGADDQRDYALKEDSNAARREEILTDVLRRLCPSGSDEAAWIAEGKKRLAGSLLMDITEYGRAAHAEMEALLACGRSGTDTSGGTLYSTTFPCHNCAKHIIASGIARVVYVEPYPKSQAMKLFKDSITLGKKGDDGKVCFESFVGLGPRRFVDLFSIGLSSGRMMKRKKKGGVQVVEWKPETAILRVPLQPRSYLELEDQAAQMLGTVNSAPEETS